MPGEPRPACRPFAARVPRTAWSLSANRAIPMAVRISAVAEDITRPDATGLPRRDRGPALVHDSAACGHHAPHWCVVVRHRFRRPAANETAINCQRVVGIEV